MRAWWTSRPLSQRADSAAPSPALSPPPGHPRFPLFDGLRGLAVLGILAFHVTEFTAQLGYGTFGRLSEVAGGEAVITFFVISGFLLYRPFVAARLREAPRPSVRRYFVRRALRILPGYWVILTLLAIYPGITGPFSHDWWRFYGYLQLYSARTDLQGIPVAWTLCIEVTFYLVLPLWALGVARLALGAGTRGALKGELLALAVLAVGGFAVQIGTARRLIGYQVGTALPGQCAWMAIGMALAAMSAAVQADPSLLPRLRRVAARSQLCWAVAIIAFGTMMATVPSGGLFGLISAVQTREAFGPAVLKIFLEAVLVAFLVAPVVFGDPAGRGFPQRLLRWRPMVGLGVISYSFYLWHLTVIELLATGHNPAAFSAGGWDLLPHVHLARTLVLYAGSLIAAGALATVSYRFVELPMLRRKDSRR